MGVGNGSQTCAYDCMSPIGLTTVDGVSITAQYTAPIIDDSELPMLLGLQSLRENRSILDMHNLKLHFCGEAGAKIEPGPGAVTFDLEISPSGHLVLPCSAFKKPDENPQMDDVCLNLATSSVEPSGSTR